MYALSSTLKAAIAAGNPQRVLLEFTDTSPARVFSNEDILITSGLQLTEQFNADETDLTIGLCTSAEIRFDMLNDLQQLDDFEFGTFKAWLGARIDSGTPTGKAYTFTERGQERVYEFAPLGIFIMPRPDIVRKKTISVDAFDQMTLFDVDMPEATELGVTYPITASALLQKMCAYLNVTCKSYSFLNADITLEEEPQQFANATMREVLGWIAEAACSNARFNREGKLELVWFNQTESTYDEHNYSDFTPTWYETQPIKALNIRNANSTEEYTAGTGENTYTIQDNPFLRQDDSIEETEGGESNG